MCLDPIGRWQITGGMGNFKISEQKVTKGEEWGRGQGRMTEGGRGQRTVGIRNEGGIELRRNEGNEGRGQMWGWKGEYEVGWMEEGKRMRVGRDPA